MALASEPIPVLDGHGRPADIEVKWVEVHDMRIVYIVDTNEDDTSVGVFGDELDSLIEALQKVRQEIEDHARS